MKFITFLKKQLTLLFVIGVLLSFTSCGSFQYSGIYDDGIYGNSNSAIQATEHPQETVENTSNSNTTSTSSNYYTTYFKEKSLQLDDENTVFTDIDSYEGTYEDESANTTNYAGWGENNSSDVTINVYENNTPYFAYGWGSRYRNNWGWNLGWNNWGYNYWSPYQYDPWYSPFCNYGYNNFGYNNYGYNYGYSNYGYNNYRGRSVSYVNGRRSIRSRNSNLSRRSVLSTTNRNASINRARTRSATRSNVTSRPTSRSTTRSRSTTSRPNTRSTTRTTRSATTSRPTTTRSTTRASRPTTTRSTRSSTRSSTPTRTRTRSSSSSSRTSRSGGTRRRNN